jgi:D-psicose/D-tagatose/L-ribulose 3-epimerase
MKIGMNMLVWTAHVTQEHYSIVDVLKETGYDGIELFLGAGDTKLYSALGRHFADMDLGVTCVTCLTPETNIASPHKKIREAGLDQLKWAIDMCADLNAEVLCGPYHSTNGILIAEYAVPSGVILAPEALNRFECYLYNTMEDLCSMVEQIGAPNLGGMYDTHHANIEEKNQASALRKIAPYLKRVHISENDRGTPGSGQVNWREVFSTLKEINYDGWLTIEAFSRMDPDFANAIHVWRNFSSAQEIYEQGLKFIKQGMGL